MGAPVRIALLLAFCVPLAARAAQDMSSVVWSHATNSRWKLDKALNDKQNPYLEADVSYADGIAVMAHPPVKSWDLSLKEFLRLVCSTPKNITLKLDFKSNDVLHAAFHDLDNAPVKNLQDLWLNADVVQGAGGAPLVDGRRFVHMCSTRFPWAVISPGWTTLPQSTYTWGQVEAMARLLLCEAPLPPRTTFPVRASLVATSIPQLSWLLDVTRNSTLTVWASDNDPWATEGLVRLRQELPWSSVYYDLPGQQDADFKAARSKVSYRPQADDLPEWRLSLEPSCQTRPLAGKRAVFLRGTWASVKLPSRWETLESKVDLTQARSLTVVLGEHHLTLEGQCFYAVLNKADNVTARFWNFRCSDDNVSSSQTPLMTRLWSVGAGTDAVVRFESDGAVVVYDVHVSGSAARPLRSAVMVMALALAAFYAVT
ncbi:protein FAM151B-like [Ixodes scapularis]|uniref:protein FAM151B-like n=1 Tax=Ixodes scapularis TaxID=6945 RepID=UPI001C386F0C|nr:protein FAM151B-like [Ixodes scapularis]